MNKCDIIRVDDIGTCRTNSIERLALEQICEFEALNISEAVRMCIREAAKNRNVWPPTQIKMQGASHGP